MALVDDLSITLPESDISRRKALGVFTTGLASVAALGTAVTAVRFLRPNVLFEPPTRFRVGRPEEIPVGTLIVLPEQKLYLFHATQGFIAMSAVCTHLGCMTRYEEGQERIFCPCHGSRFDNEGEVTGGPAPRPLDRKHLSLEDGELVVDIRKEVDANFALRV